MVGSIYALKQRDGDLDMKISHLAHAEEKKEDPVDEPQKQEDSKADE